MGLFTKYCSTCGKKIERGSDVVRYGKHFDSEEHAEQYVKRIQENQATSEENSSGGCCC